MTQISQGARRVFGTGATGWFVGALTLALVAMGGCNDSPREDTTRTSDALSVTQSAQTLSETANPFREVNGLVVLEAEDFHGNTPQSRHQWTVTNLLLASAGRGMIATPDAGLTIDRNIATVSPRLDFQVQFTNDGTYAVWVRGKGQHTNDGSCHVGLDGAVSTTAQRIEGFGRTLQWSHMTARHVATLAIGKGQHTINVFMREDGFVIDKIVLTTDPRLTPTGTGPAESPRAECTGSDQCIDGNPCTDDTCAIGVCVHANNTATCDDANSCTVGDMCANGTCAAGPMKACTASDQCHDAGTCDPASGLCSNPTKADDASCNDGNACTQSDKCQAGICVGYDPVVCAALDQCHDIGVCNTASGKCTDPIKSDGVACDDSNACTKSDSCIEGVCTGSSSVVCAALDQCHDIGTCDTTSGACSNPLKANGSSCNDGKACTNGDTCQSGICAGSPVVCGDNQACSTDTGRCEPVQTVTFRKGESGYASVLDTYLQVSKPTTGSGTAQDWLWDTDDATSSTSTGKPVYALIRFEKLFAFEGGPIFARSQITRATINYTVWNTGDTANVYESLATWNETTTYSTFGDGTLDAGELGAQVGTASGIANGSQTIDVTSSLSDWSFGRKTNRGWIIVPTGTDSVRCRSSDYTTPNERPQLTVEFIPYHCSLDAECDDDNICNGVETCGTSGFCVAGIPPTTDDANPCTIDTCDPTNGVQHTNQTAGASCTDGNRCNGDELCDAAGHCLGATAPDCHDANSCTTDTCDPNQGCVHNPVTCTSGQACNPINGLCARAQTVTFQRGTSSYSGVIDTQLTPSSPGTSNGTSTEWIWDTDDSTNSDGSGKPVYALIRFGQIFTSEGGPIPDNSLIGAATLSYTVSNTGDAGVLHESLVSWNESTTYASFGDGTLDTNEVGREVAAANGASASTRTADVTSSLSSWSSGRSVNFGWIVVPTGSDSVRARSSDYATVNQRPMLSVTYFEVQCTTSDACNDENPCTDDYCDTATGCQHVINAAPCDDGDSCTKNDTCNAGICLGSAPTGNSTITFVVHGPPTDPVTSSQGIYLHWANGIDPVHLEETGPALWQGTVLVPRVATSTAFSYWFSRDPTLLTSEVGPWGEALNLRSISIVCSDLELSREETVWNWDDLVTNTPAPAEKGPTVSTTNYDGNTTATVSVQLGLAQLVTLHYSTEPFVPLGGGYVSGGPDLSSSLDASVRHEFALSNLTPSTKYHYYLKYGTNVSTEYSFTTGGPSQNFRFVAYGDSQATDDTMRAVQRDLVQLGCSFHPNVTLRTGDLTEDARNTSYFDYFFAIERPMLGSVMYLSALGNHEYNSGNYYNLLALPPSPANEQYYAVKYGNTLFISLNTEVTDSGAQTTWLGNTLDAANNDPEIRWKVAFFHQPPYSSGMHGSNTTVRSTWHPLFRDKGVKLVLNGHDHDFEYLVSEGVNYYVIGGAGSDLRSFSSSALPQTVYREAVYHMLLVGVSDGQLTVTPYRRDRSVISQAAIALTNP